MKFIKKLLKWLLGIIVALVIAAYIFDYDYILKGVRVVYFTGHSTAFIDDYPYFENDTIKKGTTTDDWPLHKNYNSVNATMHSSNISAKKKFSILTKLIRTQKVSSVPPIIENGEVITDSQEKANIFNNFFCRKGDSFWQ